MSKWLLCKALRCLSCAYAVGDDDRSSSSGSSIRTTTTTTTTDAAARRGHKTLEHSRPVELMLANVPPNSVSPPPGLTRRRTALQKCQHKRVCRDINPGNLVARSSRSSAVIPPDFPSSYPPGSSPSSVVPARPLPDPVTYTHRFGTSSTPAPQQQRAPLSTTTLRTVPGEHYQYVETRHGRQLLPGRIRVPAYSPSGGRFLGYREVGVRYYAVDKPLGDVVAVHLDAGGGDGTHRITTSSSGGSSAEWSREANRLLRNLHVSRTTPRDADDYLQQGGHEDHMMTSANGPARTQQLEQGTGIHTDHVYDRPPSRMEFHDDDLPSSYSHEATSDNNSGSNLVGHRSSGDESAAYAGPSQQEAVKQQVRACSLQTFTPIEIRSYRPRKVRGRRRLLEIMDPIVEFELLDNR
ncbi:hypothetical protein MN608_04639 [Microdochium nivale]|nr:hypothetical protein MN608_04639 [Microdochium nivale]